MSSDQQGLQVPTLVRAKRFGVGIMVILAVVWAVLAASIMANGNIEYAFLYTGPTLISLAFALAIWRLPAYV